VAANFAVDHVALIRDYITMLSHVHGSTHGLFEDIVRSRDNAINKANVSHSIIGFLRYLSPLVGGIQEAARTYINCLSMSGKTRLRGE